MGGGDMKRAIVFDFDGTLMDTREVYIEMIHMAFDNYGISIAKKEISEALIPSIRETIKNLLTQNSIFEEKLVKKLEQTTIDLLSSQWTDHISPVNEIKNLLDLLFDNGNELYIVSNSHSSFVLPALAVYKLGKYFREVITLDSGYEDKMQALEELANKLDINVSDIIYIGDTIMDVELSEKMGFDLLLLITKSSWDYERRDELVNVSLSNPQVRIANGVKNAINALTESSIIVS